MWKIQVVYLEILAILSYLDLQIVVGTRKLFASFAKR